MNNCIYSGGRLVCFERRVKLQMFNSTKKIQRNLWLVKIFQFYERAGLQYRCAPQRRQYLHTKCAVKNPTLTDLEALARLEQKRTFIYTLWGSGSEYRSIFLSPWIRLNPAIKIYSYLLSRLTLKANIESYIFSLPRYSCV